MLTIHQFPDQPSARRAAAEALSKVLSDYQNVPVLFFVSGGSGFDVLNELPDNILDERITISVIDERFTKDPAVNNFLQLQQTDFYKKALAKGASFIETVPKDGEMIEEMAKRFEGDLKAWRAQHPGGVMIALMGIGKDGHTAGMMPVRRSLGEGGAYSDDERTFQFLFEDADVWVVGYDAGSRNQYPLRVTTTMPFLRRLDRAIVYAVGEAKGGALAAVLASQGELYKTPGRIVHEMKHCLLYTDQSVDTVKI